jgi:hypothetical protein
MLQNVYRKKSTPCWKVFCLKGNRWPQTSFIWYQIVHKDIIRHNRETIVNFKSKSNCQYHLSSSVRKFAFLDIIKCPHLNMNIPPAPGYGVYISKLIDHPRAYSLYSYFLQRHRLPSYKLCMYNFVTRNLWYV